MGEFLCGILASLDVLVDLEDKLLTLLGSLCLGECLSLFDELSGFGTGDKAARCDLDKGIVALFRLLDFLTQFLTFLRIREGKLEVLAVVETRLQRQR